MSIAAGLALSPFIFAYEILFDGFQPSGLEVSLISMLFAVGWVAPIAVGYTEFGIVGAVAFPVVLWGSAILMGELVRNHQRIERMRKLNRN